MGKECGAWVSRRLWGGGNSSPLKTTAWEAMSRVTIISENEINRVSVKRRVGVGVGVGVGVILFVFFFFCFFFLQHHRSFVGQIRINANIKKLSL